MLSPAQKRKNLSMLIKSKSVWAVIAVCIIGVAIIIAVNLFVSGNSQSISYRPHQEVPGNPTLDSETEINQDQIDVYDKDLLKEFSTPEEEYSIDTQISDDEKLAIIEAKYRTILSGLEIAYRTELQRLFSSARQDYLAANNGTKDISLTRLAAEYMNAVRNLENMADNNFANVLDDMKSELKQYNLPMDLAKQAEQEYDEQKSQMRKKMLQQAAGYVN